MSESAHGPLHFTEAGSGAPVVLIHGWATSGRVLDGLVRSLSASSRVVVPDLRGHGRSPPPPGPFSIEEHGDDVAALVRRLGLARPVLAGWSLGAQVALAAAARLGAGGTAGLALISGTARYTAGDGHPHGLPLAQVEGLAGRMRIHPGKALARFAAACLAEGEVAEAERARVESLLAADPPDLGAALGALDALAAADQRSILPSLDLPVLLVHGAEDRIVPAGASAVLGAGLPRAWRVVLPGVGHVPFLTRPREVAEALRDFLSGHFPGAGLTEKGAA